MKAKVKRTSVIALSLIAVMLFTLLTPVSVSAASSKPYKDVTVKKVGKIGYSSIKHMKARKAYKGVIKGKKFNPKKKVTKKEAIKVLKNYYGKKNVPVTAADKKAYKKTANYKWLYAKLSVIAKKKYKTRYIGVVWDTSYGSKTKVTRVKMAITLAALKDPYTDVTKKTVYGGQWSSVMYCKAHGAYKGVISSKNLYPNNIPPRREVVRMLVNFYGNNKIPAKYHSDLSSSEPATFGWVYAITKDTCVNIAGEPFIWYDRHEDGKKVNRAQVSNLLWAFASADKRLMPKQ